MSQDLTVKFRLIADTGQAVGEVRVAKGEFDQLGKETQEAGGKARKAAGDIDRLGRETRESGNAATSATSQYGSLARTLTGVVGAYASLSAARGLIADFAQQEQAVAALDTSIASMGRTTDGLSLQLKSLASQIQQEGIIGDEAIIKGQSFLTTYKDITDDLLPRTTRLMVDLAAKMGGDVTSAANMVGKASMGMVGELARASITFSDAAKESKDFGLILTEMEEQVAGVNRALGQTGTGGMKQLSNALGDWREQAGEILTIGLSDYFRDLSHEIGWNKEEVQEWGESFRTVVGYLDEVAIAVGALLVARTVGPVLATVTAEAVALTRGSVALNAALLTTVARMRATEAAGRMLRGSLAVLGGPAGLIIGGATALALWATRSDEAAGASHSLHERLQQLAGDFDQLREKEIEAAIQEAEREIARLDAVASSFAGQIARGTVMDPDQLMWFNEQIDDAQDKAAQYRAEIARLQEKLSGLTGAAANTTDSLNQQSNAYNKGLISISEYAAGLARQNGSLGMSREELEAYNLEAKVSTEISKAQAAGETALAQAWRDALPGLRDLLEGTQERRSEQEELNELLDEAERQERDNISAYDDRNRADRELIESLEQEIQLTQLSSRERAIETELRKLSADATDEQRQQVSELAGTLYDASHAASDLGRQSDQVAQIYEDTASSIRSSWSGAIRDMIDGSSSLADRLRDTFSDLLADLATMAITRPIIVPMVTGVGGVMGVSGQAQAGVLQQLGVSGDATGWGWLDSAWSSISGGYAGMSGDQAAMLAAQTTEFGAAGEAATAGSAAYAGGAVTASSVLGSSLAGGALGYAGGSLISGYVTDNPEMQSNIANGSAIGGAIGAGIGSVVPGVGTLVGGLAGSAIGGTLGSAMGTGWEAQDNYRVSIYGDAVAAQQEQEREKSWWRGSESRWRDASDELVSQIDLSITQTSDALRTMGATIGADTAALDGYTARFQGSGAELEAWLNDQTADMASAVFAGFDEFARPGETAAESLTRLAATLDTLNAATATVDTSIAILSGSATSFGAGLTALSQQIAGTRTAITETDDIQTRIELEAQLYDLVMQRYEAEQQALADLRDALAGVSESIGGMRGQIGDDIASIQGDPRISSLDDIRAGTPESLDLPGLDGYYAALDEAARVEAEWLSRSAQWDDKSDRLEGWRGNIVDSLGPKTDVRTLDSDGNIQVQQVDSTLDYWVDVVEREADKWGISMKRERDIYRSWREDHQDYKEAGDWTAERVQWDVNSDKAAAASYVLWGEQLDEIAAQRAELDAERAAADEAAIAAFEDYIDAIDDFVGAADDSVTALQSMRDQTIAYYQAQQQLEATMLGQADDLSATLRRLEWDQMLPGTKLNSLQSDYEALAAEAQTATGTDLAAIAGELNALADPLLAQAKEVYASGAGYQEVYDLVTGSLADVEARLREEAPQGYEEATIELLNEIDASLGTLGDQLNTADQAIVEAIERSRIDTVGTLEDIRELLGGEGRTLVEGSHADGLPWVPRDGYIAELHQGEAVIDAATMRGLRQYGISAGAGSSGDLLPALQRIERALANLDGGTLRLTVVTQDGRRLREETIGDIKRRSRRGETIIYDAGVAPA